MKIEETHKILCEKFGEKQIVGMNTETKDPWIEVASDAMADVAALLKEDERLCFNHLNNLTGVDYFEPDPKKEKKFGHEPHLEVVYHLYSYTHKHSAIIKVKLPRWKNDVEGQLPEVPSVSSVWAIADWHEREAYDLLGIQFLGHPDPRRILCPEDWVGYPLRKDYEFPLEYHGVRGR